VEDCLKSVPSSRGASWSNHLPRRVRHRRHAAALCLEFTVDDGVGDVPDNEAPLPLRRLSMTEERDRRFRVPECERNCGDGSGLGGPGGRRKASGHRGRAG
jgi:hypothetical protein